MVPVMKIVLWLLATVLIFLFSSPKLEAAEFDTLWNRFDAKQLTYQEKRFLQTALAFNGFYNGLLDGDWGNRSQDAFNNYSLENYETFPQSWHMGMLAFDFLELSDRDGWQVRYYEGMGISLLIPTTAYRGGEHSAEFTNWFHTKSSLGFSFAVSDIDDANRYHDYTANLNTSSSQPYIVRNTNFAITSSVDANGATLYTRSDYVLGSWSTVMISANRADSAILNAVAASIAVGKQPEISFPKNGIIDRTIKLTLDLIASEQVAKSENQNVSEKSEPASPSQSFTGTGFIVSETGKVLTNAHVVEGCTEILVNGQPATKINSSESFDLAIVQADLPAITEIATFAGSPARLNSDVTVVGYPLSGILGGLNVTRGAVSSLKGLGGDEINMQISAPVQPGNSGGPALDATGAVVGVVVAKLDAVRLSDAIGDIPQNVNFAIRGEIAKLFLFQNNIEPVLASGDVQISPVELADRSSKFTVFISCNQ